MDGKDRGLANEDDADQDRVDDVLHHGGVPHTDP